MDVSAYLDRIGYTGSLTANEATLRALQRAHLMTVPFENLDIGLGRKIICDEPAFLQKIITQRRGGFCYELNGAFAALLRALGFNVTLLSAQVPRADGSDGPEHDHLALRVDLDEPWLADVGFGDFCLEPLRFKLGVEQDQNKKTYRIVERERERAASTEDRQLLAVEAAEIGGNWKTEYLFSLVPRELQEFVGMCHYHQTSPESPFTRKRICSMATADGRITLADMKLIVTRNGSREERLLGSDEEWKAALRDYFQIVL